MILAIHSLFSPLVFATTFVICALRRNMRSFAAFSRKDLNPTELLLVAVLRLGPRVLLQFRAASLNSSDTTLESSSPRRTFRSAASLQSSRQKCSILSSRNHSKASVKVLLPEAFSPKIETLRQSLAKSRGRSKRAPRNPLI